MKESDKQTNHHYQYGNIFYKLLWHDKSTIQRLIFVFIPFVLIAGFIIILINTDALAYELRPEDIKSGIKYYYGIFDDLTNSFVLVYQLFFIYFASGKFLSYIGDNMRSFENHSVQQKESVQTAAKGCRIVTLVLAVIIGVGAGTFFIINASTAAHAQSKLIYWYSKIGAGIWYYGFLICFTLSMSTHFFLSIIMDMFLICSYKKRGLIKDSGEKSAESLKDLKSCCTLGVFFGFYSLISVATVFYSDIRAFNKFEVDFGLAGYSGGIVLVVTIFLATLYFGTIYIARYYMVHNYAADLEIEFEKPEGLSDIDISKVLVFIVTTVLPAITPLLQSML